MSALSYAMTVEGDLLRAAVVGGMIYFFHIPKGFFAVVGE